MDFVQLKLRKAIGAVKDQTTISIAKVGSAGLPDLEIAMIKATSHDENPLEEKYVQELLYLTSGSGEHVYACIAGLAKRLRKTRSWIVAIKTLMLAHRLLRDGTPAIENELASSRKRGVHAFNVCDFRDESPSKVLDFCAFIRAYGLFLDERLDCSIPSLTLPKPATSPNKSPDHSLSSASPTASGRDEDQSRTKLHTPHRRKKPVQKMRPHELMQKFPLFLRLLERVLACKPSGAGKVNRLMLFALQLIVRDSFLVYSDIRAGMAILHDSFFDFQQLDCSAAFDVYSKAAKQVDELISFYSLCKSLGACKISEYPAVDKIPAEMLETMAASLRLRSHSARNRGKKQKAPQVKSVSFQDEVKGGSIDEMNGMKSLTSPPLVASASKAFISLKPLASSAKMPTVNRSNGVGDLLDLDEEPVIASGEEAGNLDAALFTGAETAVNKEGFTSSIAEKGSTQNNGTQFVETNSRVMGWEIALIESESSLSKPATNPLGGGFDQLLLDSLYDQGVKNQRLQLAAASSSAGSASSVVMPALLQSNLLALPAPFGEMSELEEDPFAASNNFLPPAYVQMAELRHKQQLLVLEQQHWLQYQQGREYSFGVVPMNFASNSFVAPFWPTSYALPSYGVHSTYG